MRVPDQENGQL